jgi:acyl-CoA thioester hydrolase
MPCQIRWADMDAYKHVNNTAYLRYLEEARIRLFGLADPASPGGAAVRNDAASDLAWDPGRIVIAGLDIDYRRPLSFRPEPVQVLTAVTRVGRSSFDLGQQIVDGDVVHAAAECTIVAVDKQTGRSRPLEQGERAFLAARAADLPHRGPARVAPVARDAPPGPARHEVDLDLRWADMDINVHVNNVAYAAYMQEARAHLFALHDAGRRAPLVRGLVVVRMHLDWVRPLVYSAVPVRARTWFSAVSAASVAVECELRSAGVLYARGLTTLALFDFETDRPRRITPEERAALAPYLVEPTPVA